MISVTVEEKISIPERYEKYLADIENLKNYEFVFRLEIAGVDKKFYKIKPVSCLSEIVVSLPRNIVSMIRVETMAISYQTAFGESIAYMKSLDDYKVKLDSMIEKLIEGDSQQYDIKIVRDDENSRTILAINRFIYIEKSSGGYTLKVYPEVRNKFYSDISDPEHHLISADLLQIISENLDADSMSDHFLDKARRFFMKMMDISVLVRLARKRQGKGNDHQISRKIERME